MIDLDLGKEIKDPKDHLLHQCSYLHDQSIPMTGHYTPGQEITVCLMDRKLAESVWYVTDRWNEHDPWQNPTLKKGDIVTGKIIYNTADSHIVALDTPDNIFAELRWSELKLDIGDTIKARLTRIQFLPDLPKLSIEQYLLDIDAQELSSTPKIDDPVTPIRFTASIDKGVKKIQRQFFKNRPLYHKNILIIDDNETVLSSLADLLKLNGADVQSVLAPTNLCYGTKNTPFYSTITKIVEQQDNFRHVGCRLTLPLPIGE